VDGNRVEVWLVGICESGLSDTLSALVSYLNKKGAFVRILAVL
jgi:hypothetical protein